jgi:hypothetical protein
MGQCSPDVYTVAAARSSTVRFAAAQRAISNSGCLVGSPVLSSRFRSANRSTPAPSTSTDPNGPSPAASASRASSTARRRWMRSASEIVIGSSLA